VVEEPCKSNWSSIMVMMRNEGDSAVTIGVGTRRYFNILINAVFVSR
jgi:hypothetical protein